MWRESEFEGMSLDDLLRRLRAAFRAVGDPVLDSLFPGRSEDEVRSRLGELFVDPHPDVVWWFRQFDGGRSESAWEYHGLGMAGGRALSLDEAIEQWHFLEGDRNNGDYPTYRSSWVPFCQRVGVDSGDTVTRGFVIGLFDDSDFPVIPSLRHLLWWWIAVKEERLSNYALVDGRLQLEHFHGGAEWALYESLGTQFPIMRYLERFDDDSRPIHSF